MHSSVMCHMTDGSVTAGRRYTTFKIFSGFNMWTLVSIQQN